MGAEIKQGADGTTELVETTNISALGPMEMGDMSEAGIIITCDNPRGTIEQVAVAARKLAQTFPDARIVINNLEVNRGTYSPDFRTIY